MTKTRSRPPIQERPSQELVEDLCIELKNVASRDFELPTGEKVVAHIGDVAAIYEELQTRRVDFRKRLDDLTEETKWQIPSLLTDCLAFPAQLPYVRERDGLRRTLRCQSCRQAEFPINSKLFSFCERCLKDVVKAIQQRSPIESIVLFRTFNAECRCLHANDDTVLAAELYFEQLSGVCEKCVQDEIERRNDACE